MTAQPIQDHRTEATIENVRNRISVIEDLNARGVGTALWHQQFELSCLRALLAAHEQEPVAYMTYKGYLLHAGDPKLAEYSEPMPLYADPRPEPTSAKPVAWLLSGGGTKNVVCFDSGNAYADPLREVMPLYTHPSQSIPAAVPECFQRLLKHAHGMSMGVDWNNGTSAGFHREKLLEAVKDCRAAMLNGGKS